MSTYASIIVALDLGPGLVARIKLAADLADRLGARLVGAVARQLVVAAVAEAPFAAGMLAEQDRESASEELREAEKVFRDAVGSRDRVAFRSAVDMPTLFLAGQARAADLLVVGRQARTITTTGASPSIQATWRSAPAGRSWSRRPKSPSSRRNGS